MRMVKRVTKRVAKACNRKTYAAAAVLLTLGPVSAFAQERLQTAPLEAANTPLFSYDGYFPFSTSAGGGLLQGLLTHSAARDILIATMFAICLAMVFAASYLWRENVNHLKSNAERQQRRRMDGF